MAEMDLEDFMQANKKYTPQANETLVPACEYAAENGMSYQTVTAYLKKGVLDGVKFGSRWYVRIIGKQNGESEEMTELRTELERYKTLFECLSELISQTKLKGEYKCTK